MFGPEQKEMINEVLKWTVYGLEAVAAIGFAYFAGTKVKERRLSKSKIEDLPPLYGSREFRTATVVTILALLGMAACNQIR